MLSNIFTKKPVIYRENKLGLAACGDSLELLRTIKDHSIDLIFADPPYNIGKDFGHHQDSMSSPEYIEWCKQWITECMRILSPNGTFYLMAATQYMPILDVFIAEHHHILSRIIWTYDSSGVQSKKKFGSLYEPILMIVNNPNKYTFNTHDIEIEAKTGSQRKLIDYRKTPPQPYNTDGVICCTPTATPNLNRIALFDNISTMLFSQRAQTMEGYLKLRLSQDIAFGISIGMNEILLSNLPTG